MHGTRKRTSIGIGIGIGIGLGAWLCLAAGCSTTETANVAQTGAKPAFCADEPRWRMPSCPCGCLSSLCIGTGAAIGKTPGTLVCDSTSASPVERLH